MQKMSFASHFLSLLENKKENEKSVERIWRYIFKCSEHIRTFRKDINKVKLLTT